MKTYVCKHRIIENWEGNHPLFPGMNLIRRSRRVMAEYLDRTIRSKEHIHHKDGNPFNDSIENLELLSCSEHMRKHALGRKWKKSSKEKMSKTMQTLNNAPRY